MTATTCKRCGQRVNWAITRKGKRMPVDPQPDPEGNLAVHRDGKGEFRARVLVDGEEPAGYERRCMPHFATCPPPGLHAQPVHAAPKPAAQQGSGADGDVRPLFDIDGRHSA